MLAVRRAHQQRVRELCVVHFSLSTGIVFWIDVRRNEKWWACFYVNWLLSAHPRPVIRELTIRRNKPRIRRNSIKASHLSLISQCMGEIRNSQMCGDTSVFDLCTSYCQPSGRNCSFFPNIILVLGAQPEGGGVLKKLTKHHLHRPRTSYISLRRPLSFLNSEEIRASIMYFSSDYL